MLIDQQGKPSTDTIQHSLDPTMPATELPATAVGPRNPGDARPVLGHVSVIAPLKLPKLLLKPYPRRNLMVDTLIANTNLEE